jgi:hypothetical protein
MINLHKQQRQMVIDCLFVIERRQQLFVGDEIFLRDAHAYMNTGGFLSTAQERNLQRIYNQTEMKGKHMLELFTDIESLPVTDPDLIDLITEGIKPPANYSNKDTIAKWEAESKPLLIKEAISKTALDGTYGRVCCISYAFNDEPVQCILNRSEKKVITQFFDVVQDKVTSQVNGADNHSLITKPIVIGHNVHAFDLKFMWKRAIINGIKPQAYMPWDEKAWGDHIADTMLMWDSSPDKRISLHKLCIVLGVPSPKDKNGMTGADVYTLWQKREYEKIKTYATDDVEAMRSCYRKMSI